MKYFFITMYSIFSFEVFGQQMTKGLIMPNRDNSFNSCCVYIPSSGLRAYDRPNGKQIAQIVQGPSDDNSEVYKAFINNNEELIELNYHNFHMVGYEVMALVYTNKQNGFVQINNGYWLSIAEIESKELALTNWMEYLITKEDVLGWYAKDPGLNLRTKPSASSDIIITLKGDLFEISPTQEIDGFWCKVKVIEYKDHPCTGEGNLIIQTLEGWVKILSDDQTPNVWEYGKGC